MLAVSYCIVQFIYQLPERQHLIVILHLDMFCRVLLKLYIGSLQRITGVEPFGIL